MPKSKVTSKAAAKAASKVLKSKSTGKAKKSAAGRALRQRPCQEVQERLGNAEAPGLACGSEQRELDAAMRSIARFEARACLA